MTRRTYRGLVAAAFCLAGALLTLHLSSDWRLLHEDNGALQTTLALSHIQCGLAFTRCHDVFVNRNTGAVSWYGHHPPGLALVLAGAFSLTGSAAPAVARSVVILFHLGSLLCMARLLIFLFPAPTAAMGTLVFAVVPMSAYFGRMVNYEAPCLFGVLVQLLGFVGALATGRSRFLALLAAGVVVSGLVDWPAFFFAAAIGIAGAWRAYRGDARGRRIFVVAAISAAAVLALDLAHMWWAARGSLQALVQVIGSRAGGARPAPGLVDFVGGQIDSFRRYYTHTGLAASVLVVFLTLAPSSHAGRRLLGGGTAGLRAIFLGTSAAAACAYVLAAPSWARIHPYWKFYFLPFVAASVAVLLESLHALRVRARRLAMVLILAEVAVTSASMLHLRHTRRGTYAIEQTARFRERYLTPADVIPTGPPPSSENSAASGPHP